MENIKFSIIVPCYNSEKYIDKCVASVLDQTYSNWELLLIDDESSDNTLDIIRSYESRDQRIHSYSKGHGGLPNTRNYGLNLITGDYLVLLDSDDYLELSHLEKDMQLLNAHPCDMLIHNQLTQFTSVDSEHFILFEDPGRILTYSEKLELLFSLHTLQTIASAVLTTYSISFLKRHDLIYNESCSCSEDLDFFMTAISQNPSIEFAYHEFYHYRKDNPSSMTNNITLQMELDRLGIYKKWFDHYEERTNEPISSTIQKSLSDNIKDQIYICLDMPLKSRLHVKKYLKKNKYLFTPNGFWGSFEYLYYIRGPLRKLKRGCLCDHDLNIIG